jgi:hypothetical protein
MRKLACDMHLTVLSRRIRVRVMRTTLPDTDMVLRAAGLCEFVNVLHSRLFREALRQDVPMADELQRFVVAQAHMIKLNLKKNQHFRCAQDLGELPSNWSTLAINEQCSALARLGREHPAVRSWRRAIHAGIEVMMARKALEESLLQKVTMQAPAST